MKIRSMMVAALAALTLAGCSKDGENGTATVDGEDARMSISFTLPTSEAAPAALRTQNATTAESTVNSITVYVFNASSGIAATDGGFTHFTNIAADFTQTGNNYKLNTANNIKTLSGNMKVYVAANLPTAYAKAYATETLLLAAFDQVSNLDNSDGTTGFTMFSEGEPVTLVAYDPNTPATVGSVSVALDRVVSKMVASVGAANYTTSWTNGMQFVYEIKTFGVYNEANDSYLAKNPTTKSTLNSFTTSWGNHGKNVGGGAAGHPSTDADRNLLANYYIGENITGAGLSVYGKSTYAMVTSTVTASHEAEWNNVDLDIDYTAVTPYGGGVSGSDIFVVNYAGIDYVTSSQTKADAIYNGIIARDTPPTADEPNIYIYKDGYVHFMVYVNREDVNDYRVGRNEFIHVKVNGVYEIEGVFPGYPGDSTDPTKPIDPTDPTDPNNPDPKDPDDNIDPDAAMLNIEIDINPWTYKANEVILGE